MVEIFEAKVKELAHENGICFILLDFFAFGFVSHQLVDLLFVDLFLRLLLVLLLDLLLYLLLVLFSKLSEYCSILTVKEVSWDVEWRRLVAE